MTKRSRIYARVFGTSIAVLGLLTAAAAANAATLTVSNTPACPTAQYTSIQAAVNAANPGDTVVVCPGTYMEGTGKTGTNALEIAKDLTIQGAGADQVTIEPRPSTAGGTGQIAEAFPNIRDGKGDVVAVIGGTQDPVTVNISGVTVTGNGVFANAGVVFLDAQGTLLRSRVTGIDTNENANAYNSVPGGFRSTPFGYGVAMVTAATSAAANSTRQLTIDHTRVDQYNGIGVLIDGATSDFSPSSLNTLTPSGILNYGVLTDDQIAGRNLCTDYNDSTSGFDGDCEFGSGQAPPLPTLTGPLYGQDGVRVSGGALLLALSDTVSSNLSNGSGAPVVSIATPSVSGLQPPYVNGNNATNNQNLRLSAGFRFIGAHAGSVVDNSNIDDNGFGVLNTNLDGQTSNTGSPVLAQNDFWGLRDAAVTLPTYGPAIWPSITSPSNCTQQPSSGSGTPCYNPPLPENPVNGDAISDPTNCAGMATNNDSDAVTFCPYRDSTRYDEVSGEWPIVDAPIPVNDYPPAVTLNVNSPYPYQPGQTVTLTANAIDDFGVQSVAFYDNATLLATDTVPPYTTSFTIPANEPCGYRAETAVATDSSGQTTTSNVQYINVVGSCVGGSRRDVRPTLTLRGVPATLTARGAKVVADASVAGGISTVRFYLGKKLECTSRKAPYSCVVRPTGADVGSQTLRVVASGRNGSSAEVTRSVRVAKFAPRLVMNLQRHGTTGTITGSVKLPRGVSAAQGCSTGHVTLIASSATGAPIVNEQMAISRSCGFRQRLKIAVHKHQRIGVVASYGGSPVLRPVSTSRRFHS